MPITDWGWEITSDELQSWIIQHDNDIVLLNKPALVVCHPSKKGPWSSLVGACREHLGLDRTHLIARLDRETSGIILLAKHRLAARHYQMALERRAVTKTYLAILEGPLTDERYVDAPIGKDTQSLVHSKSAVRSQGRIQDAQTRFAPLFTTDEFTLVQVTPITGRKHQIRVHASHMGHPIAGDKLYGPDETFFLDFIETGWTAKLAESLPLNRQALHAYRMTFEIESGSRSFVAPPTKDLIQFCERHLRLPQKQFLELLSLV